METDAGTRRVLLVDAFADEPLAGAPVGLVPSADGLAPTQMAAMAGELAAPRTAFCQSSGAADRRLRTFARGEEVTAADPGAVVASHAHLRAEGRVEPGTHTVEVDGEVRRVAVEADGTVWTVGEEPSVGEAAPDYDRVAGVLGIDPATLRDVGADLPPAVASIGTPFLVVPVNFFEGLGGIDPDPAALAALAGDHGAAGVYAFTFDALSGESTLHARAFLAGGRRGAGDGPAIPTEGGWGSEVPATGAGAGACAAYLRYVGAFEGSGAGGGDGLDGEPAEGTPDEIRIEQGSFLDRPGVLRVEATGTIRVGGRATPSLDGSMVVPEEESDEIIEA